MIKIVVIVLLVLFVVGCTGLTVTWEGSESGATKTPIETKGQVDVEKK